MPNQPTEKPNYFRAERQVHPELKNYYHINHFRGLSDSNFFLLCVDTQTLDLLHSLKEPKYYARWKVEVNNRDERISTDEDKSFVDYVWGKLEEQLADVACLSEITDVLKELVAIKKMELAAKTDGIIRDHYPDPARLDEFAAKVGLTVGDLPTSDMDLSWPELSRFDDLGANRKMIDEVPSVWISEGMLTSKSMAEMYADTMYETPIDEAGVVVPVWIGAANSMAKYAYKFDLALRHLNAKFSRNGQVQLELPDEPHVISLLSGDRVSIRAMVRKYLPSLVDLWPLFTYTSGGSVFTWGELKSNDPQKYNPDVAPPHTSHLAKTLHESLRSVTLEETTIVAGTGPILGNTPSIPATPISGAIPAIPYYAGTTDINWPAMYGMGIADMLKLPEKAVTYEATALGLPFGVRILNGKFFAFIGDNNYQMFPRPSTIAVAFPKGDSLTRVLDSALRFTKPTAAELASTDPDEFAKAEIDNSIWARISGLFASTPNVTKINFIDLFNQVFRLADDDPNLRSPDIATHAQILNALQMPDINETLLAEFISLVDALQGSVGQSSDMSAIAGVLTAINNNISCLVLTQQAINEVEGGADPGCIAGVPIDPAVTQDCQAMAALYDELVNILDWLVWGVETVGGVVAAPIVSALTTFRWFTALLVAAGLVEPSPAEEIVTVPLGIVALLSYVVERVIALGAVAAREMVNALKLNRVAITNLLCGATDLNIETQIDSAIQLIKDAFTDAGVKVIIQDLLDNYLKAEQVKGVILSK